MATQNRAPTGDGTVTGTVSGSAGSRYTLVDDYPNASTSDMLTFGTATSSINFTYSAFTVPAGSTSISVQVRYVDGEAANGANNCGGRIIVNGANQNAATHNPSGTAGTAREDNWATNPVTAAAWTVDQVNGVGSNALTGFGINSTDSNPTFNVRSIEIQVTYTASSVNGDSTQTISIGGSAAGGVSVQGASTGALSVGGTAAGVVSIGGVSSSGIVVGGTAAGEAGQGGIEGVSAQAISVGGSAAGAVSIAGASTGAMQVGGSAVGGVSAVGVSSSSVLMGGQVVGVSSVSGASVVFIAMGGVAQGAVEGGEQEGVGPTTLEGLSRGRSIGGMRHGVGRRRRGGMR